jgi:hypothetical protein
MNRETVSDVRLEQLIASHGKYQSGEHHDEYLAFLELKSIREAQPPAGCAELAREIVDAIGDDLHGDYYATFDRDIELPVVQNVLAAKLAPLFGLLAECRKVIGEYRSLCECELYPECRHCCITREFLQRIDAALGKGDAAVKGGG